MVDLPGRKPCRSSINTRLKDRFILLNTISSKILPRCGIYDRDWTVNSDIRWVTRF